MDNLPKGWKNVEWNDVLIIKNGKNQRNVIDKNGIYPIYGSGGIMGYANDFICNEDTTIIGRKGSINNPIFVKSKFWNVDTAFGVCAGKDLDNKFLHYFCLSYDFSKHNKSTTLPSLTKTDLLKIPIPLPTLSEQTRIVAKLDALFARIDKSIALLEENIKHTKALMASVLEEVFHSSTKQIAVSEIVVKTVNINPLVEPDTQFTYIDITSVNNRLHQIEDPKIILGKNAPSRAKKLVVSGDIVFATTRPNLKNIAIVNKNYSNPVASTGFCVLRTKKKISNEFLFLCLLSNNVQEQIKPFIRGAQYPAISDSDLLKCKIPDLSYAQQIEFANKIMNLRNKLSKVNSVQQSKLVYFKALKSSLLDRAFKGEL